MPERTRRAPWTRPSLKIMPVAASTRVGPPNPTDNVTPGMAGS